MGNPSGTAQTLLNITKSTLKKNLMNVINVGRLFHKVQPLNSIRKFVTKKRPSIVANMVNHRVVNLYSFWALKRRHSINYTFIKNILLTCVLLTWKAHL